MAKAFCALTDLLVKSASGVKSRCARYGAAVSPIILILFSIVTIDFTHAQSVIPLSTFLDQALQHSEEFRAVERSLQSLEREIAARDLELTPVLTTGVSRTEDNKARFSGTVDNRSISDLFNIGIEKPFSTGTTFSLTTEHEIADRATLNTEMQRADWEITLSQSLWRNSLGRATRLRREADQAEKQARRHELTLKRQALLQNAEGIYWDLALGIKENQIAKANLERSIKLEDWVRRRVRISAAESTDLLQAQALVTSRKMEALNLKNKLENIWSQVREILPLTVLKDWTPDIEALEKGRQLENLVSGSFIRQKTPRKLEALVGYYRQIQAEAVAQQVEDSLRPDLSLEFTHGRNGIDTDFSTAWERAGGSAYDYTQVGLVFSLDLDFSLKEQKRTAARLTAEARRLEAEQLLRKSNVEWQNLVREVNLLKEQLQLARQLYSFQLKKSQEERKRFQNGRSTAFQAITFEVEAAQAELQVYRLLSELRKTESRARLFQADGGA